VVQGILAENGLPKELYYLGLIESGYVNHARSHANAVGVWQFIKGTGQRYGLQMNNYVDERQDPIRATEAAARYLRGLYNVFQSWELVMSAYNCGEYRVLGSVMKTGIRDYWKLTNKGYLPRETRDYVPKFMAAVIIGLDPEKYGFKVEITEGTDYPNLELVEVSSPISLAKIAQTVGMSLSELRRFNPHLHKGITPPGRGRYEVWIPQKQSKVFANELAQLAPEKGSYKTYAAVEKETQTNKNDSEANGISSAQIHIVKRGENLAIIAAKYNQTISHLRNINGLTNTKIRSGQRLRLMAREYHAPKTRYHRVRNGENLTTIARFYGTTVPKLKQLNRLSKGSIQRGQKLLVSGQVSSINEEIPNNNKSIYRVRKGDTLESIAERFGTTIANLRKINRLKGPSIFVGQSLTIKKNSSSI
jgi:membrane-bound lytic murein transglycosylase D